MANTGYQINPQLKKVTNDANELPLDINNMLCSLTGLPQDLKANPTTSPDYKILNPTGCTVTYTYVKKADFQKNNCSGIGETGSIVTFSKTYTSTISIADAENQATADVANFNAQGQVNANTVGVCNPPLPSDAVGIIVIDLYNDKSLDVCAFVDSPEFINEGIYQEPIYKGKNFLPVSTAAANCWGLASDQVNQSNSLAYRFEFNVARMLNTKGNTVAFYDFKIRGRGSNSGNLSGAYSLKGADSGTMTMQGSAGSFVPSTQNSVTIGLVNYSGKPYVGGGNGSIGIGIGADILHFRYDVVNKSLQLL